MVLQRHASGTHPTLRVYGLVVAYAFAMATGTAVLIAAFGAFDDGPSARFDGSTVTAAEVLMQQTAERALPAQDALQLAFRNILNDKRGF